MERNDPLPGAPVSDPPVPVERVSVAALVSGIAGVVVGVSPPMYVLSLRTTVAVVSISGILAVGFGVVGLRRSRVRAAPDRGMAIAGIVLGIVVFLILVGLAILLDANQVRNE